MTPFQHALADAAATVIARVATQMSDGDFCQVWRPGDDDNVCHDVDEAMRDAIPDDDLAALLGKAVVARDWVAEAMAELGATVQRGERIDVYTVGNVDDERGAA